MADVIAPDPSHPANQIALTLGVGDHAGAALADGAPLGPHKRADRGLGGVHRKSRDLILKVAW